MTWIHRDDAPLVAVVGLYVASRYVAWWWTGADVLAPPSLTVAIFASIFLAGGFLIFAIFHLIRSTLIDRSTGGLLDARTWRWFAQSFFGRERFARGVLALLTVVVFGESFSAWKRAIAVLHPFSYDQALLTFDRWLHFGTDPWVLIHPIVGYPLITAFLQGVYTVPWAGAVKGMVVLVAWADDGVLRARALLSFVVVWIVLGTVGAMLFSSVGPAFLERLTGDPTYRPLMDYLHHVNTIYPVHALTLQDVLWKGYLQGGAADLGISAMPSMHVASIVLCVLVAWHYNRTLGWWMALLALLVVIGSVHLGWHYAVDAYVSIPVTVAIWYAVGRFLRWYRDRESIAERASPAATPARVRSVAAIGAHRANLATSK